MPLVGWAILVQPSKRTPSVTRSVLAKSPLPTSFPSRGSSLRTPGHRRCRHRQGFVDEVMPVNPRSVVESTSDDAGGGDVLCHSTYGRFGRIDDSFWKVSACRVYFCEDKIDVSILHTFHNVYQQLQSYNAIDKLDSSRLI